MKYVRRSNLCFKILVHKHKIKFPHHYLANRNQSSGETLDEYLQALKSLSKICNRQHVTAEYCKEPACDAFIRCLLSNSIRQRLLENKTLRLETALDPARVLDTTQNIVNILYANFCSS